jgi:hypothetical protein
MNIEIMLPRPTEDELNLGAKSDYFQRIIDGGWDKKCKITQDELMFWIHHNYQSVFLLDEELSLSTIKKLK